MRPDALGLWWRDEPIVKVLKEKIKRTPPEPVWLLPDYLPHHAEALAFDVPLMNDEELWRARARGDKLLFDVEVYPNYFLVSFASYTTGAVVYFEMTPEAPALDTDRLRWLFDNFTVVGFNSYHYDLPMLALALAGKTCAQIKGATDKIIIDDWRASDVLKAYGAKALKPRDHIDLIEVAPLSANLKIYGGRLHAPRMQDLPFHPAAMLSDAQRAIVRWYNVNDLVQTGFLYAALEDQIALRETLGREYRLDLRSRSDAQIAEAVITEEITRLNGHRPQKVTVEPGTVYYYAVPGFLRYETPLMNWALDIVRHAQFVVGEHGSVELPQEVRALTLEIAGGKYRMGIGGLHSSETNVAHVADEEWMIVDRDVTSYYPSIILNLNLYPPHLGPNFIRVFRSIVERRVHAKHTGDKVTADSLKITANGTFGKTASKYSVLYAPNLMFQVTLTGQLSLLMLIERLELRGIHVVSANTDGIVIMCQRARRTEMEAIVASWERDTGFETEETEYCAHYARDVNNYIAIKADGKGVKSKGAYNNPWAHPKQAIFRMHKNPVTTVCLDAVEALLTTGTSYQDTIRACRDIRKFVVVRRVKGGAVQDGEYLGGAVRWYYSTAETGEMVYARSGNKVPRSDGARPLMQLPEQFPDDVDFEWYERETEKILREICYL